MVRVSPVLRRLGFIVLVVVTVLSFAPVAGVCLSIGVAETLGCTLDESRTHRCMLGGADIGDALATAFVLGWLMLVTWPGMLVSLAVWGWLAIRALGRRGHAAPPPPLVD